MNERTIINPEDPTNRVNEFSSEEFDNCKITNLQRSENKMQTNQGPDIKQECLLNRCSFI